MTDIKQALLGEASAVCKILQDNGFEAYIVGGAVRDAIIGTTIGDMDVTTNATPKQVTEVFNRGGFVVNPVGEKFGTVQVQCFHSLVEITTYRSEGEYTDKRHPDSVKFETDLVKDLERRDFTMNAIAYDPVSDEIIDPFDGRKDLDFGDIKAVGNPEERFREDPLRMLRMCRFAGKLGFNVEFKTVVAVLKLHSLITKIPVERVKDELFKILQVENFGFSWHYLRSTKLLGDILPELASLKDMEQPREYHKYDVLNHSFLTALGIPRDKPLLRLAGLLHDVGKRKMNPTSPYFPDYVKGGIKIVRKIYKRLKLSNKERVYLEFMVKNHMIVYHNMKITTKGMRRFLSKIDDLSLLYDLFYLIRADMLALGYYRPTLLKTLDKFILKMKEVLDAKQPFTKADLKINGHDLMGLGVPPAPILGKILDALLQEVIENPELNNREYLLKRATELLSVGKWL